MPKYGNGLNKEIFEAVIKGEIPNQFTREDIREFINFKSWDVAENTISVSLSNGAALEHSPSYKKYFVALGNGKYKINSEIESTIERKSKKRFAIAPTDHNWFLYLRDNPSIDLVNFWTPTPWNIKGLKNGERLYFMLKAPIRMIGGYGEFSHYENLSLNEAWQRFGKGNGVSSLQELQQRATKYTQLRSIYKQSDNSMIGCIVMKNLIFFEDDEFISDKELGVDFPSQIVKIKYFDEAVSYIRHTVTHLEEYKLVGESTLPRKTTAQKQRVGQSIFRRTIFNAYDGKCAITGETCTDLLEAAHIEPYKSEKSNHIQNGILMRVDFHKLFDAGLMTINSNYEILFSSLFLSSPYLIYQNKKIYLPINKNEHPSSSALEFHYENVFRNK